MTDDREGGLELPPEIGFLRGGGRAARLILDRDWSDHALGPPGGWPAELKTALSLVLNSPESMILAWGRKELSFFFNDTYMPLLAARSTWATGTRFDRVWADVWGQAKPIIDDALAGRGRRFIDMPWTLGDNATERRFTFSCSRVLDAEGETAGLFILTNDDLETTVAERTKALWLHQRIIESDATAICAFDTEFRLIAFNQAHNDEFHRVNGFYTKLGDVFWQLFVPEQQAVMKAQMARALTGETFSVEEEFGNPEIDAPRWEILYSPLRNEAGEVIGAFHHARDVSARLRAQAELATAQEALRQSQKMEAMGQLTGGVAHDFNNLLTPIVGTLDLLQRKALGGEREQRLIAGAAASADRARTLVQRLLAFARRQPLQTVPVDVSKLIGGMMDLIGSTTGPQIRVIAEAPNNLSPAIADPHQLEMSLLNLAVNARDAMPNGGTLRIAATLETVGKTDEQGLRAGRYVRLSVTDTGIGMDEETMSRAVEPFYSTKGVGKGTGLGLSMVHGVALQLGGALRLSSRPEEGTTVELWLPESTAPIEAEPARPEPPSSLKRGTALLVDDEELVRQSTADMLIDFGYRVLEAASAEAALTLIRGGAAVDLVVTDHLMPGMSGSDLARKIQDECGPVAVLVISGYAESEGIAPDLPRLTKPFRRDELFDSLAAVTGCSKNDAA